VDAANTPTPWSMWIVVKASDVAGASQRNNLCGERRMPCWRYAAPKTSKVPSVTMRGQVGRRPRKNRHTGSPSMHDRHDGALT
jgi:hypothetical protein